LTAAELDTLAGGTPAATVVEDPVTNINDAE
jgi:hypothetical protein